MNIVYRPPIMPPRLVVQPRVFQPGPVIHHRPLPIAPQRHGQPVLPAGNSQLSEHLIHGVVEEGHRLAEQLQSVHEMRETGLLPGAGLLPRSTGRSALVRTLASVVRRLRDR
jgi:hypothetical protein